MRGRPSPASLRSATSPRLRRGEVIGHLRLAPRSGERQAAQRPVRGPYSTRTTAAPRPATICWQARSTASGSRPSTVTSTLWSVASTCG